VAARDLHSIAALQPRWVQSGPKKRGWQGCEACEGGPSQRGGVERWGREEGPRGSAVPRGTPLNTVLQSSVKGGWHQRGVQGRGVVVYCKGV